MFYAYLCSEMGDSMETVEFQSFVFLYTLYGGILIGLAYDIYRVLKGRRRGDGLIKSMWDIGFLALVLLIFIWAIFSSNYGDLRAYVFIGFLVGFLLYQKILSRIAVGLFYYIKNTVIHFFRTTNSIILLPFKFLINLIWLMLESIFRFFSKRRYKLARIKSIPRLVLEKNRRYFKLIVRKKRGRE